MKNEQQLKEILAAHLSMGQAFMAVDKIIGKMPFKKLGVRPANLPYSFYELFYHMQYAQNDILEYCLGHDYEAPPWPEDYWPDESSPKTEEDWEALKEEYIATRENIRQMVLSPQHALTDKVATGYEESTEGHTLFREVLLVIEHSAYHTGQLVLLARLLETYPEKRK